MSVIYEPKGRAREYSPLACNLYMGCNHECKYCYCPPIARKTKDEYKTIVPKKNVIKKLEKECVKHRNTDKRVLLSFMTDPYSSVELEPGLTRKALHLFYENRIPVTILTKAGINILWDLDIIIKFGNRIQVGASLTFDNDLDSKEWERGAAYPIERLEMLRIMKKNDVKTWASFEPVIYPEQSLNMIERSLKYVDFYKIGKLNNYKGLDKKINWQDFLVSAIDILEKNNKSFYIKKDLRDAAKNPVLYRGEEDFEYHEYLDRVNSEL